MKNVGIRFVLAVLGIVALATAGLLVRAGDEEEGTILRAKLSGFQEVPPKFALAAGASQVASGEFSATISPDGTSLTYTLSWSNLTAPPLFAHIHFAPPGINGAIMTFLCKAPTAPGGSPTPPAQVCDGPTNTITGTITAANIGNPNLSGAGSAGDQGIDPGQFANFLRVIRLGESYANVHTPRFPGGEIRGRIRVEEHKD